MHSLTELFIEDSKIQLNQSMELFLVQTLTYSYFDTNK